MRLCQITLAPCYYYVCVCMCVLGETTIAMRESLDILLRRQYDTATKNLCSTAQQLLSSQQIIQVKPVLQLNSYNQRQWPDGTGLQSSQDSVQ